MKIKLSEILKYKNKYKNKCFIIGMVGLSLEDILKYKHILKKDDLFEMI